MIELARITAIQAHGNQLYGDKPYRVHLDAVAALVIEHGPDAQVIAYLHDIVEDTAMTVAELAETFDPFIAGCVDLLTDPEGPNRKTRKAASYARLGAVDRTDSLRLALVVKAADRLANIRASVQAEDRSRVRMYWNEQENFQRAVYREGLNDALFERIDGWFFRGEDLLGSGN